MIPSGGPAAAGLYDVLIIGAGMVGSMVLRELSRFRLRAVAVDRETQPGFAVTRSSLSYIHRNHFNPPGTLRARLCRGSQDRFRALSRELGVGYREADEINLAFDADQARQVRTRQEWAEKNGETSFRPIGREEVLRLEPHLSPDFTFAVHSRAHGMIHPPEWAFALVESARLNGAEALLETGVTGVAREADGGWRVHTDRGDLRARFLVNAAGLQADRVAAMAGENGIRLHPTRGTFAIFDSAVSDLLRHIVYVAGVDTSFSQVLGPTLHGNLILGLGRFREPERRTDTRVSRESLEEILRMGRQILPALPERDIITFFAGIKTTNNLASNGDFFVGPTDLSPRLIHVLVGSPGVTASPGIARYVVDLLSDAGLDLVEKPDFRAELPPVPRFRYAGPRERAEMARRDPACAHLVCRCEQVSEAEVREAVRRGARTIDGVKHVTRAGMGRCQGGFCGPWVLKLLSEEQGIPLTGVTRRGRGSEEVLGLLDEEGRR